MSSSSSSSSQKEKRALRQFSLAEIIKATYNFDEALLIRRGRHGNVYKGTYLDHVGTQKTVAVRWFTSRHIEGEVENSRWFELTIEGWSQIYHPEKVVPVIGYCKESDHFIMVYEYMSNGSLANNLCKKTSSCSFFLSWEQCLGICVAAAHVLEEMHTKWLEEPNIVSDVTATNILLDENGDAKISDIYEELVMGDYMASCELDPHYHTTGLRNMDTDVYAFGVLLIRVLCRKVWFDYEDKNLGIWLKQRITDGTIVDQIIHPDMKAQIPPDRLKAFMSIAGACLDIDPKKRPTSTELVKKLDLAMAPSPQRLCHSYSFHEIEEATNNFEHLLGEGGEGSVYRGKTETNIPIAVKLLKPENSSSFETEIEMLSTLDHQNLVSLVGYCHESDQKKILIYECVPNGDLRTALSRKNSLSWEQRLNICVGVAHGLKYLHTGTKKSPKGIIHRDMKPANILLSENFDAKISDFGLSKMSLHEQLKSEIPTAVKGTRGYFAPEYNRYGFITRKIDVYAFGVILHEVLCGKKPWDRDYTFIATADEKYSTWAKKNVDPRLEGEISPYCLEAFTDILEKCLNEKPDKRPSMNDVVSVLENVKKWQEAWLRNDFGLVFYLPGADDRIVLYYKSKGDESSELFLNCLRVRLFLRGFGAFIDERDPTNVLYAEEFKHIFGNTNNVRLPKVFVRGKYVGSIELLNKPEELAKLLGVPSPRFICKSCGEDRTCNVCNRVEWFVRCNNCDALTILSEDWERVLIMRSCLECNGNMSITKVRFEKAMGSHGPHTSPGAIFLGTRLILVG